MSIIDYTTGFVYDNSKSTKELALEYYNKYKSDLKFHLGDNVKVDVPFNAPASLRKSLKDKTFQIIDIDMDYNFENPLSYVLNTGIDIILFKEQNLIKVSKYDTDFNK